MRHFVIVACTLLAACDTTPTGPNPTEPGPLQLEVWDKDQDGVVELAHRSYGCCFPENTLVAIEGAFNLGTDAVEIDVWISKDTIPVLMHDSTLVRTTGASGIVSKKTLAELKQLDPCSRWTVGAHPPCKIPTLEEALVKAGSKGGRVLVDYKPLTPDSANIAAVLSVIRKKGTKDRIAISSERYAVLRAIRAQDRNIPLVLITYNPVDMNNVEYLKPVGIAAHTALLSDLPEFLNDAEERGISMMAFTIRTEAQHQRMIELGVKRVITAIPFRN